MRTREVVFPALAFTLAVSAVMLTACVSVTRTARSTAFEEPKVSAGVVAENDEAAKLAEAVAQLERQRRSDAVLRASMARRTPQMTVERRGDGVFGGPSLDEMAEEHKDWPGAAGRTVPLGKLSETEVVDLLEVLALRFQSEFGYTQAAAQIADFLPPADPLEPAIVLARNSAEGLRIVRLSHRWFVSQGGQLLAHAMILGPDEFTPNSDVDQVEAWTQEALAASADMKSRLTLGDLEAQVVQLSYVDADVATKALKSLGVRVLSDTELADLAEIEFERLPLVIKMPSPEAGSMTLVNPDGARAQLINGLFTVPISSRRMDTDTVAGPSSQLLVLFHPAHPEQHSRVLRLLEDLIDVAARQVFIEGMVIEIGDEGLKELGVEWQFQDGSFNLLLGTLSPQRAAQTLDAVFDTRLNLPSEWAVRLKALVTERKAEILSRPSVVTLDNRQATIRVGTDIPVATSQEGLGAGSSKIAFDFKYIPTGILLNVRPRIDAESDEISLQIDTTVSSPIPGQDLELVDEDGRVLASAPTIASRQVQTYARIPNNTPLIIGGLVSRQEDFVKQKVPLLGDLPLVGPLFQSQRWEESKREVIIVLTPYVLPENASVSRMRPRSEETFDIRGYTLHRDLHRLREAEVFDLRFLTTNDRLVEAKRQVNELVRSNFRYASVEPFSAFTGDSIPGEHILVERMMYEVIKNLSLADPIDVERIIYFAEEPSTGYAVRFLRQLLVEYGEETGDLNSFFEHNPGSALAFRYYFDRHVTDPGLLGTERIPEVSVVDCADRAEWRRLLWEMNQPDEQGRETATVLLQAPEDLVRLRRAIVLKRMALLNGGTAQQRLTHFDVGTMLQIPDINATDIQVLDSDVAKHFFHTEHYYSATIERIEESLEALSEALPRAARWGREENPAP
ncbi:MAG: type II secretion system protein GspD [Phycisphaerales bacterium]